MPTPHQRPRPHLRTVRAHDRMLPVSSGSGMPSLCSLRIAVGVVFQLTLREVGRAECDVARALNALQRNTLGLHAHCAVFRGGA